MESKSSENAKRTFAEKLRDIVAGSYAKFIKFLLAGLPSFLIALPVNYLLVEYAHLNKGLCYALVLICQVTVNFFVCRIWVFEKNREMNIFVQFLLFLSNILFFRLLDWAVYYVLVTYCNLYYIAVQLGNILFFSVFKFFFSKKIMEGEAEMKDARARLESRVEAGICCGCGACAAADRSGRAAMRGTAFGPVPSFSPETDLPEWITEACPAYGVKYPELYLEHYGKYPENWLLGHIEAAYTGYSGVPEIRRIGASGGVLTHVLCYLLEHGLVDGVIAAKQGVGRPLEARAVILKTRDEILSAAQSVYIPVSMLDILSRLEPGKKYALTALPETSAALRVLQQKGMAEALQIAYVLGPYTGTALYPAAIDCYLRANRVAADDPVTRLQWRAGNWPGYLQIDTASGRVLKSPKIYYNFLIPFFVTQNSLQSMDFTNEFADIAVGDAWSPKFEKEAEKGAGGQSIVVVRSGAMAEIVRNMRAEGLLCLQELPPENAGEMHGHMIDFKKRGGYIRNRWRRMFGRPAPDNGYRPAKIAFSRILVEIFISTVFCCGKWRLSRYILSKLPESFIGPIFNFTRLKWKSISRPSKRKGLKNFRVVITEKPGAK